MKLTHKSCEAAKPKDKPYKLSDGGGLYLEVMPNGSKCWRMKYRILNKEKRLALGGYAMITTLMGALVNLTNTTCKTKIPKDKAQEAVNFIISHCPDIGAFSGNGEPYDFLQGAAADIRKAPKTHIFPDRHREHIAYAVDAVGSHKFLSSQAAVASVYLATRFEFYFRILSEKLNDDGTWRSEKAQTDAQNAIKDKRLKQKRVSSLSLAYDLMMLFSSSNATQYCRELDKQLNQPIGKRIEHLRHAAGHGEWGDISSEAVFYGLMTAVIFYSENPSPVQS